MLVGEHSARIVRLMADQCAAPDVGKTTCQCPLWPKTGSNKQHTRYLPQLKFFTSPAGESRPPNAATNFLHVLLTLIAVNLATKTRFVKPAKFSHVVSHYCPTGIARQF